MLDRARITVPTLVTNVWKPRYEDHFAFMVVLRVGIIPSEAAPKIRNPSWTVNLGIRCFGHNIQVTRLRTGLSYINPTGRNQPLGLAWYGTSYVIDFRRSNNPGTSGGTL